MEELTNNKLLDDMIICRCESIRLCQLREAIQNSDFITVNRLKKITRAGMGQCQGRTCAKTLELILEKEAKISMGTEAFRKRPPIRGVPLETLAATANRFEEPAGPVSILMTRRPKTQKADKTGDNEENA